MATVTLTSGCNSFPHNLAFEKREDHLRDVSFSSYVNGTDESFVLKLAAAESNGSVRTITATTTTPPLPEHLYLGRKKELEDGEIGVFGAEKYFSGGMDEGKPSIANKATGSSTARRSLNQNEEGLGFILEPIKTKIQPSTPSLISESSFMRSESSWDSQSTLLMSVLRNPLRNKTRMTSRKSLLSSLRSKCSCSDKNSVETTDEHRGGLPAGAAAKEAVKTGGPEVINLAQITKRRSSESWSKDAMPHVKFNELGIGLQREKCFAFPIGNSGVGDEAVMKPRKSLEIFGSSALEKGHKCLSLERRLTMLSWEATPRVEEDPVISKDTESDASSDLFEIDSLTSRVTPFLARQESDNTSGCVTPTTCYAPSEASIEWSVVTGSVADFSVMSDCDELRPPSVGSSYRPVSNIAPAKTAASSSKELVRRRHPSIVLSGCKNDKAVRVAGDAYITNDQKGNSGPRGNHIHRAARTRFEAETTTTLSGFGSRGPFSASHSQHASSRLLYI